MAKFIPTPEQENAINARGSVTVTAAAGSGKTAVLTKRVLERITGEDAIDADRLLIVTFTNAAAEEMRNRIRDGMNTLVEADPNNQNLLRQQALLSKTEISTIDSFCINLARENFFKLNLPPDFKPSDNSRLEAVKSEAMNDTFEEYYLQNDADFENMLMAFGDCDSDMNTVHAVEKVYDYICSLPYPFDWLNGVLNSYKTHSPEDSEWIRHLISSNRETAKRLLLDIDILLSNEELTAKKRENYAIARETVRFIQDALDKNDYDAIHFASKTAEVDLGRDMTGKTVPDILKAEESVINKRVQRFIKGINIGFAASKAQLKEDIERLLPIITKFIEVIRAFHQNYMQKKTEQGIYGFSDIERMVLGLLAKMEDGVITPTEDAQKLASKYDEVMVDEYQDTNDLQDTIFRILSDDGKKLFTVGDAKQSIYRFRQANPENFINRIESGKTDSGTEVITLAKNFRSRKGICDFSNFIFSLVMNKKVGDIDYNDNNHLVFGAEYYPQRQGADVVADVFEINEMSQATATAHRIAAAIKSMMQKECVTDKKNGVLRRARYADFAVLAAARTDFAEMAKVLTQYSIPVWVDEDEKLNSVKEIQWALSVIKVVCNPTLDVALVSAMLSPAFGFSAEEAAEIKLSTGKCNTFFERLKKHAQGGNKKATKMLDVLASLRKDINSMPLDKFVHKMYEKTGLMSYAMAMNGGASRRANLLKLCEVAAEYESFGGEAGSFARFVENSESLCCPKTVNEADDVVKLMTIHRSKGLEFPVVFLASLFSQGNKTDRYDNLIFDRKLGIGLKITDRSRRLSYSSFSREAASVAMLSAQKSEKIRLLYVAMTRASETLYMMFPGKKAQDVLCKAAARALLLFKNNAAEQVDNTFLAETECFADILLPLILTHPSAVSVASSFGIEHLIRKSQSEISILTSVAEDGIIQGETHTEDMTDQALVEDMKHRLSYQYPYLELNGIASKYSVTSMLEQTVNREYFYSSRPEFESAKGLTPTERGTAMHRFLEVADFTAAANDLEEEIKRLWQSGYMSEKYASSLDRKKLNAFFDSDIYKRICSADTVFRELRFMTEEPAQSVDPTLGNIYADEKVVIQGIADCVIEENGLLTVIDYKTDRIKEMSELHDRYARQLEIYSKCIEKCLKKPVKECIIYSLFKNESINLRKV